MSSSTLNDVRDGRARGADAETLLVGPFTRLPGLIRQFGVDPDAVLAEAEVKPEALANPFGRIPWTSFVRLIHVAAARTNCPHLGLRIGQDVHVRDLGPLGELVRYSPTVNRALQEFVVNQHLNSEGTLIFLLLQGDSVDLGYAVYVPFSESTRHVYDGVLAILANVMRDLCGEDWRPSEVLFPHSPPVDLAPYSEHFRARLKFDSPVCALRFPAQWLPHPVKGADPERLRSARALVATLDKPAVVDKTLRSLRTLLLHGKSSGADVAQSLAMHRRTLNRRLMDAGVTFQQVLDRVRFAVAKELLEETNIGLPEIADALGYANSVSLIPAFRRWTGMTPGAWRDRTRQSAGDGLLSH